MNNRVLKFRVWDKTIKQYRKDDVFMVDINGYLWFTEDYGDGEGQLRVDLAKKDIFTIQQFTGLKDKNGKEIYEGDIVSTEDHYEIEFHGGEVENRLGKIVYSDKNMAFIISFNLKSNKINEDNSLSYDTLSMSSIKIKGNIFENPEFLK